ncbi:hypothetical protein RD1_A0056 (plasmid) [Roseobacter denitrificans OCh 114]|uniref:Uncharacterized protein n=1 Tax=Roseobacter denitrificans (strain ATCC 33942 / OCh 114) TaxID=375451 RepID=Q07GP3_ROSDO|nr:hypothetical protein RD1_A0056 [Roseobacter denitrificans OCh 114]
MSRVRSSEGLFDKFTKPSGTVFQELWAFVKSCSNETHTDLASLNRLGLQNRHRLEHAIIEGGSERLETMNIVPKKPDPVKGSEPATPCEIGETPCHCTLINQNLV